MRIVVVVETVTIGGSVALLALSSPQETAAKGSNAATPTNTHNRARFTERDANAGSAPSSTGLYADPHVVGRLPRCSCARTPVHDRCRRPRPRSSRVG